MTKTQIIYLLLSCALLVLIFIIFNGAETVEIPSRSTAVKFAPVKRPPPPSLEEYMKAEESNLNFNQ